MTKIYFKKLETSIDEKNKKIKTQLITDVKIITIVEKEKKG